MAVGAIGWGFVKSAIDIQMVVLKAPLVDDDVCSEYGCLNVFRVPMGWV